MKMQIGKLNKIYVLNVRSFKERREHIKNELRKFNLEANFIFDWDPSELNEDVIKKFFKGSDLSLSQKSIAMKHIKALEKIVEANHQSALVLEDDVVLAKNFCEGVKSSLQEASIFSKPHVIFIGCGGNFYTPKSERREGQSLYANNRGRFGDSYILGTEAAALRLEWIYANKISKPIDNQFEYIDNRLGITMFWLEDPVVEQGSKNGLFKTELEAPLPKFYQKIKFIWEKVRRKYIYQLWK